MSATGTVKTEIETAWDQALSEVACDLKDIKIKDALTEDGLCDYSDELIGATLKKIIKGAPNRIERAKRIYRFAREEINYLFLEQHVAPASQVLATKAGGCLNKSILATALYRRAGIPAICGVGLVKSQYLANLIDRLMEDIASVYSNPEEWSEELVAQLQAVEESDKSIQGGTTLHVVSCVRLGRRWFEADVTQNSEFMIKVLQADKYFPQALWMWNGTFDYGLPERFFVGEKKRLKYLTRIEDLKKICDFSDQFSGEEIKNLFNALNKGPDRLGVWLGA